MLIMFLLISLYVPNVEGNYLTPVYIVLYKIDSMSLRDTFREQ